MTFQQSLQNYIQNENIVQQSEQSLLERKDQAEQTKIQLKMARDEAAGQIAMGGILPIDMVSRLYSMKNMAKRMMGIKDIVGDNDALKNVKGWAKKKLGMKDTDGDDDFDPDAIHMQPVTSADFEEPSMETREVQKIGSVEVTKTMSAEAPVIPKTRRLFGVADDWLSGGDQTLSGARARVEAMPSSVDWEDIASNTADYTPPLQPTYAPHQLAEMARESAEMKVEALRSSAEKGLGKIAPEETFKYKPISQGQHEYESGVSSAKSDLYAESRNLEPISTETASRVVLPDFADLAEAGQVRSGALGFGERFGGGTEVGMARAGGQRGTSMLASVMTGEEGARAMPSGDVEFKSMPRAWLYPTEPARRIATTGEELSVPRVAGMEQVPEITPTIRPPPIPPAISQARDPMSAFQGSRYDVDAPRPAEAIPQFQEGGEAGDIPDFPEGLQVPSSLREQYSSLPSSLDERPSTTRLSKLKSGLGLQEEDDLDEEGGEGGSILSSLIPSSMGEAAGTGLAVIGFGTELYMGITQIKDAFRESALVEKETQDIARESQAIYNRPTFDFGQQAISNRDSGLGESSFNHF